jgi:hypothetical protein
MWKERDRIDAAWKIRSDQQDMIKFADQKVGAVLALSAVLTGFVLSNLRAIVQTSLFARLLAVIYLAATLMLLMAALRAILARGPSARQEIAGRITDDKLPKVVYFGHIRNRNDGEDYWSEFNTMTEQGLLRDLCHQNWELSRIAGDKYRDYRQACWWLLGQLGVFLLLVIVLLKTDPAHPSASSARALVLPSVHVAVDEASSVRACPDPCFG